MEFIEKFLRNSVCFGKTEWKGTDGHWLILSVNIVVFLKICNVIIGATCVYLSAYRTVIHTE
jgi:hypothetical protein